jgi:glycosyltransferase involved in cell wall biosynthesis
LRVLYLADVRFPLERANGIQTMETCYALAERGHDIVLLVRPDTLEPARDPFEFYGLTPRDRLRIARVKVSGPAPVRRLQYLIASLEQSRNLAGLDVVLTRDLGCASLHARVHGARSPALVYESHGYSPSVSGQLPNLLSTASSPSRAKLRRLARREQTVWQRADGYVTITRALAEELAARLGPRERVDVVPDGARIEAGQVFDWEGPAQPAWATYAGHLYPWKGVDTFIEALALAPGLCGRIVGGHPGEADLGRLRALTAARGLGDCVEFTGMVPPHEVARWLRASDVLVLPNRATDVSARYTSPLKLFEYLAAGRPIVASDLPALREVLHDGENALLVPPDDAQALSAALQRVTADRPLAVRLARRAFEDAQAYSWGRRAERLESVLAAAVARRVSSTRGPHPGSPDRSQPGSHPSAPNPRGGDPGSHPTAHNPRGGDPGAR